MSVCEDVRVCGPDGDLFVSLDSFDERENCKQTTLDLLKRRLRLRLN